MIAQGTGMTTLAAEPIWNVGKGLWFGDDASTVAPRVDSLFMFIFWVSTAFFLLIVGLIIVFVIRHRRLPGVAPQRSASHNTPLELAWTFLPMFFLAIMFVWGFRDYMYMHVAPAQAEEINLTARQWSWLATYDHGGSPTETMHLVDLDVPIIPVPKGRPIKVVLHSVDVLHAFWVPDFRVKIDVIPNRYTTTWFEATGGATQFDENGQPLPYTDHYLFCAEYCGNQHSQMAAIIRVMDEAAYQEAKAAMTNIWDGRSLEEVGQILAQRNGCFSCHSADGSAGTGPTWLGIWGKTETVRTRDGATETVTIDENYVRESIYDPGAKIVDGFANQMTPFTSEQIDDQELGAIIAYIKSLGGGSN
ncbi:MAG: cytochrome c oxidase subunit II [Planctomycetota bacterium]|nr:MAG: cytochrome c oxidase subunit II [Planctomycetota bacterium]